MRFMEGLESPPAHDPGHLPSSLRGAKQRSNPAFVAVDCFAEPVIGVRYAPTRWLATTEDHTRGGRRRLTALRRGERATRGCSRLPAARRGFARACRPRARSLSILS